MKSLRVALVLCGTSLVLSTAGAQTGRAGEPCARQTGACHEGHGGWLGGFGKKAACAPQCQTACTTGAGCCTNNSGCAACNGACQGQCNGRCCGPNGTCCCTQYQQSLQTPLGVCVRQELRVGEIQVDECKLERILESRRRQRETEQRLYEQYIQLQDQFYAQQCERQLQHYVHSLGVAGNCALPYDPQRACPPAPVRCELPPPPPAAPLRPTEIPLVIPVTLELGVENTCLGQPCVRSIPLPPAVKLPCTSPCGTGYPAAPHAPAAVPNAPAALPPAPATSQAPPRQSAAVAPNAGRVRVSSWYK